MIYLHLAEKDAVIGSSIMRQFCVNAFPMLVMKVYEFKLIQITPGVKGCPTFLGYKVSPRIDEKNLCALKIYCY